MTRKLFLLCCAAAMVLCASAQNIPSVPYVYTEASEFTLVGKLFPDTPNPYHRLDTVRFKGFTKKENLQVRESSGIAVAFRTNSKSITVKTEFGQRENLPATPAIATQGYDLYILKEGRWLYAGAAPRNKQFSLVAPVANMDGSWHDCLLYLPLFSEELSVQIGIEEGAQVEALPNPFRWRVGVFGSSFTHGACASRSGMTYPAQFSRHTGIQLLSLGCSGNCKLQPYFAAALAEAQVDAFLFDTFSNPSPQEVQERLFPFIETLQAAHPGKPLIFQHTIYREYRNFNLAEDLKERRRTHMADSLMNIAVKRYKDVYYIKTNATDKHHDTSVDGIHPGDHGYALWADSIEKQVLRILRKYGIR